MAFEKFNTYARSCKIDLHCPMYTQYMTLIRSKPGLVNWVNQKLPLEDIRMYFSGCGQKNILHNQNLTTNGRF